MCSLKYMYVKKKKKKVSYNCPSNSYQIFCKLGYNSENSVFSQPWNNYFETVYFMCIVHRQHPAKSFDKQ